jgi:hypothetical protein
MRATHLLCQVVLHVAHEELEQVCAGVGLLGVMIFEGITLQICIETLLKNVTTGSGMYTRFSKRRRMAGS